MRDISARELKGHNILAVERFRDNTRWMIEFSVLRPGSYGSPGDETRLFLTEDGYQAALLSHQRREIKIKKCAHVIEGHVLYVKKNGGNEMFREKEICDAIRTAYLHLFPDKRNGNGRFPDWTWSLWRRACAIAGKASLPTRLPAAMRVPWTITGRSCFPSGDAAFIKNGPKSFHAGGCRLYPGTMAPG